MEDSVKHDITEFFSHYPSRRFKKGQILIYGGDNPNSVYHLKKGVVKQYDISDRGDEIVVNVFKSPAFFPMSWAINRTPNPYFFETTTAVELNIAPADDVVTFLKTHPSVMFDLLRRLYSGTDGLQRRMAHLMGGSAKTRLVYELVIECKRFGTAHKDGSVTLSISESSLAERTGLSRETVSREISKLKNKKILMPDRMTLKVLNLHELENILGNRL